jgi:hypothetical protein
MVGRWRFDHLLSKSMMTHPDRLDPAEQGLGVLFGL